MVLSSTTISLNEFILHTKVSEAALLSLMDQGVLPCVLASDGRVRVDVSKIPIEKLASLLLEAKISEEKHELVDSKITSLLEPLLDEAITMAFTWLGEDRGSIEK